MALVIKGKRKGQQGDIMQFANDWVSVDFDDGCAIMNPTMLLWEPEELERLRKDTHLGLFWGIWEEVPGGTFKRRKRK